MADPLQLMVEKERIFLLEHPVVRSFIYLKWRNLGAKFYAFNFTTYLFFVIFLCLFAMTINHPLSDTCIQDQFSSNEKTLFRCGSQIRLSIALMSAACVIILAVYHMLKEIVWLILSRLAYFISVQNYIEWVIYITSIIFVVFVYINDCGCPSSWQWQIGILSVFLGCVNLIFLASNVPYISLYVIMFKVIFVTFFKLILFALVLVTAFSVILFMMFHNPASAKISSFSNFAISFMSTLNMIAGGVGFDTIFGTTVPPENYIPIPYHAFNSFMWILFLLLFPIIFKNMLTSLAVGDVMAVRDKAELRKVEIQVKVFSNANLVLSPRVPAVLRCLFNICQPYDVPQKMEFDFYSEQFSLTKWFSNQIWGEELFLINIEVDTYAKKRATERKHLSEESIDEHQSLKERLDKLLNMVHSLQIAFENARK